ncbi:MAG TPA: hypothetical protein VJO34_03860 [Methylomirabilota bacterium]|nr:hypothetical protein [Methylomirabilota bacterium]
MFGIAGFIIIALAIAVALGLTLASAFGSMPGAIRAVRRTFWCPFKGRNATAEIQEQVWDGTPVDVTQCSLFAPPSAVTCERLCLTLRKLPPAKEKAA